MFVNLYSIVIGKIQELEKVETLLGEEESVNELSDLLNDLMNLRELLLSRFDPYLKYQLQRRGITIIQNTYTGFDTEYEVQDPRKYKNRLISVQTAIQRRTIIKVPVHNLFDISYVHPLTSELSNVYKNKVNLHDKFKYNFHNTFFDLKQDDSKKTLNELKILNNCLKFCIKGIRKTYYSMEDEINSNIITALKAVKGVD